MGAAPWLSCPQYSGPEVIRKLKRLGCQELRSTGKHQMMLRPSNGRRAPVPCHGSKDIKQGTLRNILNTLEFTVEEFIGA